VVSTELKASGLEGQPRLQLRVRFVLCFAVLATIGPVLAEWPVELTWPGVPLGYPKIAPDGRDGAFVAGSGPAYDWWDMFLFHVDSAGNSLWDPADSSCYLAPGNQYPLELHADGNGGCVVVIDDEVMNFPQPSRHRVQIVRYDADGHRSWQFTPYDTTWEDLHQYGTLAVTQGQVDVFWYSAVTDSAGDWMTRLRIEDGIAIDDPGIRRLGRGGIRQSIMKNDSLFLLAIDTVFCLLPATGDVVPYRYWGRLYSPQMLLRGDSMLIVGRVNALGTSAYILRTLHGDTIRNDTVASNCAGATISALFFEDELVLSYARDHDLFQRLYAPDDGLLEEVVICNTPESQSGLLTTSGRTGIGIVWEDRPASHLPRLWMQQWNAAGFRWEQGTMIMDSIYMKDLCEGGEFGYLAIEDPATNRLRVQPLDTTYSAVGRSPRPYLPRETRLWAAYPNPFNGSTQVRFELCRREPVRLQVFDVLGELMVTLADGVYDSGNHVASWQAEAPSGIYFVSLITPHQSQTQKVVLIR
jgi:hypothetical protein